MTSWETYKGLELPDTPSGDAGTKLKADLKEIVDRAPYKTNATPGINDDSTLGFSVGSRWLNTTTQEMWFCTSATAGAAVWRSLLKRTSSALVLCPADAAGQRALQVDTGGNSRGVDAVDFQSKRTNANHRAGSPRSFIAGGEDNSTSVVWEGGYSEGRENDGTGHSQGYGTTASTTGSPNSHAEGYFTTATSIGHAEGNSTSANQYGHAEGYATIAAYTQAHAEGANCATVNLGLDGGSHAGGYRAVCAAISGFTRASGRFAADGDAKTTVYMTRARTTNATQTDMARRAVIPTDTTWAFMILLVARNANTNNESAAWQIQGCIDNNAGTTALVGTVVATTLGDDSAGAWTVVVDGDNTNDVLRIRVTGQASKTIRWVARVALTEVTG